MPMRAGVVDEVRVIGVVVPRAKRSEASSSYRRVRWIRESDERGERAERTRRMTRTNVERTAVAGTIDWID
jgi:hypothetical protein